MRVEIDALGVGETIGSYMASHSSCLVVLGTSRIAVLEPFRGRPGGPVGERISGRFSGGFEYAPRVGLIDDHHVGDPGPQRAENGVRLVGAFALPPAITVPM